MVDYVVKFQNNRVNFVSFRRFLIADNVIYLRCFFSASCDVVLTISDLFSIHIKRGEIFTHLEGGREERVVKVSCSVVNCSELLV